MSSGPRHKVARPAQYTCPGSLISTRRSAFVYVSTASEATGSPATARARANPATPTSSGIVLSGEQAVQSRSGDALQVLAVLDDRTERRRGSLRVEHIAIEFTQCPRPIQRFVNAGRFDQLHAPQRVDSACHLVGERLG